jgi:hypothetical protein
MAAWAWTPAVNALSVLYIIKPYKRYILSLIGITFDRSETPLMLQQGQR